MFKSRPKFDEGIFESYVHLNLVVLALISKKSNLSGRFLQIVWPSQNELTLVSNKRLIFHKARNSGKWTEHSNEPQVVELPSRGDPIGFQARRYVFRYYGPVILFYSQNNCLGLLLIWFFSYSNVYFLTNWTRIGHILRPIYFLKGHGKHQSDTCSLLKKVLW